MNHIYFGISLSFFFVFLAYLLSSNLFIVTVFCLIIAYSVFKYDSLFRYVATHVACLYNRICEICCNIENMNNPSGGSNGSLRKNSDGAISRNNMDNKFLSYNPKDVHNLSRINTTPYLFNARLSPISKGRPSLNTKNNVSGIYDEQQKPVRDDLTPIRRRPTYEDEAIRSTEQCPKSFTISPQRDRNVSPSYLSNEAISSSLLKISNKSALDARLYANVNSPGFCSRVAEHLSDVMTHQPKYDTVGAFPVVNLKSNSPKTKIKPPVRVRLAPRSNDLLYSSVGMNSLTSSPVTGADESMKSVLQVLKEISRKRIHSHVEEDTEETSKRLRVNNVQYNNDSVLHTTLLQQTIQGKRAREETSPNEDDVKKRRRPLINNEITSSLSSSLSIKPPHLKTTKRKAPDIDDSVSPTPTVGKQLKIQTEITPPLPKPPCVASVSSTSHKNEVQHNFLADIPKLSSAEKVKPPLVTEDPKISSPAASILSKTDDEQVVSRLLGRMSTPVEETCHPEIPEKNVFMSTNDLSLSPPKENRLAAMIAVLGGPSENFEESITQPEIVNQPERNLAAKALFTSPLTPDTPKQLKKVTFRDTLTETKIFDKDKCASPSMASASTESSNEEQTTSSIKPLSLNFGLSPFSPGAPSESTKPSSESNTPVDFEIPSASTLVTQSSSQHSTTLVNSIALSNNSTTSFDTSISTSGSESIKPHTFNFGAVSSPGQTNQGSMTTQISTNMSPKSNSKPFSFVNESNTASLNQSKGLGSPSLFPSKHFENGTTKPVTTPALTKPTEQSKPSFSIFSSEKGLVNSNKNEETKTNQLVNGFMPTSTNKSTHSFFSTTVPQASPSKSIFQSLNTTSNGSVQSSSTFSFGSTPSTIPSLPTTVPQTVSLSSQASSASQPQSTNIFNNGTNNLLQSNPFNKGINTTSQASSGNTGQIGNVFNIKPASNEAFGSSQSSSIFGNNSFGASLKDSKAPQNTAPVQANSLFGGPISDTPKLRLDSGASTQPGQNSLGFTVPTTNQVTPFGIPTTNHNSHVTSMFGNTSTTTQSPVVFGSVTTTSTVPQFGSVFSTSTVSSTQPSMFSASGVNQASKSTFLSSAPTSPFGVQTKDSVVSFGSQNSTANNVNIGSTSSIAPNIFGNQTTLSFGSQNNSNTFSFGNTNSSNTLQGGFNASVTISQGTSNASTEVKPPAFNSSSTFMLGSSVTTTPNKESGKPFGTVTPFSFGSNLQHQNQPLPNPTPPSVATFGNPSTFPSAQPIPSFTAGVSQPTTGAFTFGQQPVSGPTFQFNAIAPQPTPGGMFSIGSGGSSAVRSKTGSLRRRHKPT